MRVKIEYTITVDDAYRRAINHHEDRPGLATRQQVKDFVWVHGTNMDDEIMARLEFDEEDND